MTASNSPSSASEARRPIAARDTHWARAASRRLIALGLTPNQVSGLSVAFALLAALGLAWSSECAGACRVVALLGAAIAIQLRLLCNLFDGMMAVEGGMKSPVGDIYNDLPDRIADPIILIAAGCAARHLDWGLTLGWTAALLSLMTAYVRMLGAAGGLPHDYVGPMAKQHRMAIMTIACIVATLEPLRDLEGQTMRAALAMIVVGGVITVIRRVLRMAKGLRAQAKGAADAR